MIYLFFLFKSLGYICCMNKILNRIIEVRKAKGFVQKQMADKLGIAQVNYGKIETGKTELTIDRLFKIADILEMNVIELINPDFNSANFSKELHEENKKIKNQIDELKNRIKDKDSLIQSLSSSYKNTKSIIIADIIVYHQDQIRDYERKLETINDEVEKQEIAHEIDYIKKHEIRRLKQLVVTGILEQSDIDENYKIHLENYLGYVDIVKDRISKL